MRPSRIHVTVDVVVVSTGQRDRRVLLVQRKNPPFKGRWAIPGGFVEVDESLEDAALRELREETGVGGVRIEQLRAFGAPHRDPRGRTVTVAYVAVVRREPAVQGASDAADARWWPLNALPPLAFDHADILDAARQRLRAPARASRTRSTRRTISR